MNLSFWINPSYNGMARLVAAAVSGTRVEQVEWPADRYFVETGDYISDIGKISGAMGWRPRTPLIEGIERTVAYYTKYREKYW